MEEGVNMSNRDFNAWLSGFRESIVDYGYYINYEKVHRNVDNIKVELNILNSLIGSKNIKQDFENLVDKYTEVLKCVPLLLAVRANEIYAIDSGANLHITSKIQIFRLNNTRYLCEKRFDYVIKTPNMIYGIETNFYGGGGSKLNETARSYKTLALETDTIDGFTFVWFTDGKGWTSARHNLEETFDVMEHIYNINDMENGIITEVFK